MAMSLEREFMYSIPGFLLLLICTLLCQIIRLYYNLF